MNGDIVQLYATRPAERRTQLENIALNEFDAALHEAHVEHSYDLGAHVLITRTLLKARSRQRLRAINIAVARVAAQLARIEGES